jgi:hypothetical protein
VRRPVLAVVAMVAAALTTGASAVSGASAAPSNDARPTRLVVIDNVTDISFPAAPAPGVTFTSTADAMDTTGHKIGDSGGMCGILTLDQATLLSKAYCTSIWTLPGGQIQVAEEFSFAVGAPPGGATATGDDEFDAVVTGGTGQFRGVRGEVHFQHVGDAPSGFFQFKLTFFLSY